jgi:hypothetical protein
VSDVGDDDSGHAVTFGARYQQDYLLLSSWLIGVHTVQDVDVFESASERRGADGIDARA